MVCMAETLGSLVDKLSIVKLKQFHTQDDNKLKSLDINEKRLIAEIDSFLYDACSGNIPHELLAFEANKVYKKDGNEVGKIIGSIGELTSKLSDINCKLWHVQEKVYEFESVPVDEKDNVVKQIAVLNLERNVCIDEIDKKLIFNLKN